MICGGSTVWGLQSACTRFGPRQPLTRTWGLQSGGLQSGSLHSGGLHSTVWWGRRFGPGQPLTSLEKTLRTLNCTSYLGKIITESFVGCFCTICRSPPLLVLFLFGANRNLSIFAVFESMYLFHSLGIHARLLTSAKHHERKLTRPKTPDPLGVCFDLG